MNPRSWPMEKPALQMFVHEGLLPGLPIQLGQHQVGICLLLCCLDLLKHPERAEQFLFRALVLAELHKDGSARDQVDGMEQFASRLGPYGQRVIRLGLCFYEPAPEHMRDGEQMGCGRFEKSILRLLAPALAFAQHLFCSLMIALGDLEPPADDERKRADRSERMGFDERRALTKGFLCLAEFPFEQRGHCLDQQQCAMACLVIGDGGMGFEAFAQRLPGQAKITLVERARRKVENAGNAGDRVVLF